MTTIRAVLITPQGFAPFGDLLAPRPAPDLMINAGRCERHHALAQVDRGDGEAIISIFRSQSVSLPHDCALLERHPLGSQAFMPLGHDPWLSVVATDKGGKPGDVHAFLVPAGIGINLHCGVWHSPLTPLNNPADFLVVDRAGKGENLEEFPIKPITISG